MDSKEEEEEKEKEEEYVSDGSNEEEEVFQINLLLDSVDKTIDNMTSQISITIVTLSLFNDATSPYHQDTATPTTSQEAREFEQIMERQNDSTNPNSIIRAYYSILNMIDQLLGYVNTGLAIPLYITLTFYGHGCVFNHITPENTCGLRNNLINFISNLPPGIVNITSDALPRTKKHSILKDTITEKSFPQFEDAYITAIGKNTTTNFQFEYIKDILLLAEGKLSMNDTIIRRISTRTQGKTDYTAQTKYITEFFHQMRDIYQREFNELHLYGDTILYSPYTDEKGKQLEEKLGTFDAYSGAYVAINITGESNLHFNLKFITQIFEWCYDTAKKEGIELDEVAKDKIQTIIRSYINIQVRLAVNTVNRIILFGNPRNVIKQMSILCTYHIISLCIFAIHNKVVFEYFYLLITTTETFVARISNTPPFNIFQQYIYDMYWQKLTEKMCSHSNVYSTMLSLNACRVSCNGAPVLQPIADLCRRSTCEQKRALSARMNDGSSSSSSSAAACQPSSASLAQSSAKTNAFAAFFGDSDNDETVHYALRELSEPRKPREPREPIKTKDKLPSKKLGELGDALSTGLTKEQTEQIIKMIKPQEKSRTPHWTEKRTKPLYPRRYNTRAKGITNKNKRRIRKTLKENMKTKIQQKLRRKLNTQQRQIERMTRRQYK